MASKTRRRGPWPAPEIARRKQTKKRAKIVTPGPNRERGYCGRDSRPIARNPKYGETNASPGRGTSIGLSPGQLQHSPRAKTWRSPASKHGCGAACAEHPWGVASARAPGGVARATRATWGRARGPHAAARRTPRLVAAGGDMDGGTGGGTRGRQRRGRDVGAGGRRGPGKRRRCPTSRLPYGTR